MCNNNIIDNNKINFTHTYDYNQSNIRKVKITYIGKENINNIIQKMIEYRIKNN